jgi:uncharacterized protein DUF1573
MKNMFLAISLLFLATGIFAQAKNADEVVKFKETVYDFGKIKQGVPVTHDFEFSNISAKPVVVESATASCGCTTPSWPQAPVAKGKSDKVKAGFNAAAPGAFTKQITVKLAGVDLPTQLTIKGEVLSAEAFSQLDKNTK